MNGNDILLDTNFILDYFRGEEHAVRCFDRLGAARLFVSEITEMELLSYPAMTGTEMETLRAFLHVLNIQPMNGEIKECAIALRRATRRKLPDAIIAATAVCLQAPLVTNDKALIATAFPGFRAIMPDDVKGLA